MNEELQWQVRHDLAKTEEQTLDDRESQLERRLQLTSRQEMREVETRYRNIIERLRRR